MPAQTFSFAIELRSTDSRPSTKTEESDLVQSWNNHRATPTCVAVVVCHKQVNLRCVHSYSYRCTTSTQSLTTTENKINENENTNECNNSKNTRCNWKLMLPQGGVMHCFGHCTRRSSEMKMLRKCAQCAQRARAFQSESVQWKYSYKSTELQYKNNCASVVYCIMIVQHMRSSQDWCFTAVNCQPASGLSGCR